MSDFVFDVKQDINGKLWFSTRDGFCRLDGNVFTDFTDLITTARNGKLNYTKGGIFFNHLNGICFYDGNLFTNFTIHPADYQPPKNTNYRPYYAYCAATDNSNKIWFGTQEKGVGIYDGTNLSYLTDKNLAGPAVRSIFQDKNGIMWFGNNGGGLFRYDGKTLRNLTEEKKLTNYEFLYEKKMVNKEGSLARVFAINEDEKGNIWIGTVDAGVWKYDGANLVNYTTNDGLSGNSVYVIAKDNEGKLWFVSNGEAVFNFDGKRFSKVTF